MNVEATTSRTATYPVGAKSSTHSFLSVQQWFTLSGTAYAYGSSRSLGVVSSSWHSKGSGAYVVDHTTAKKVSDKNYVCEYNGISNIIVNGRLDTYNCIAILSY